MFKQKKKIKNLNKTCINMHLLQADFSVSSSGETYCAVPTKEFALAAEKIKKERGKEQIFKCFYNAGRFIFQIDKLYEETNGSYQDKKTLFRPLIKFLRHKKLKINLKSLSMFGG